MREQQEVMSGREVDRVAEALSRGARSIEKRWLSAKQRDWLYGAWLRSGGHEVSASFPGISGMLADGAHWNAAIFGCGRGGCYLSVGMNARQMEDERMAAADEMFF